MKKFMFALLLLAGCTATLQDTSVAESDTDARSRQAQGQKSSLIPGSMVIEVTDELADQLAMGAVQTKSSAVNSAFEAMGVMKVERIFPDAGEWEPRHRAAGLHRFFRVSYNPEAVPATKAAVDFSTLEGVLSASPARRIRPEAYFDDPYASKQWNHYNDGPHPGGNAEAGCDINVQPVWSTFTGGSSKVIVAVVDGGVQMDHPDLSAAMIPAGENGSWSFVEGHTGAIIAPTHHGTHVAGIIGAVSNNGVGISGIAGGLDGQGGVRILSCAVFMTDPSDPEKEIWGDTADAMVYAADHGAVVVNNSWGYVYHTEEEALNGKIDSSDKAAVDYFIKYAGCDKEGNQRADSPMKGGLVIFSAGNSGWKMGWPAAYEPIVAVAATNARFSGASYTNYGSWVDICAPGGEKQENTPIYSTVLNGSYGNMQGTSMAAPQVTGVAALIVSHFGGPGFTNADLRERLLGGASKTKVSQDLMIGPMVDALGSFTYAGITQNNPPVIKTDYKGDYRVKPFEKLAVEYTVSDPDGHEFTVQVTPSTEALSYSFKNGVVSVVIAGNVAPHGKYTAHIAATDQYGATTDYPINYEILENHAPKAIAGMGNLFFHSTGMSESYDLTKFFEDEDGEPLSYSFSMTEQGVVHFNASGNNMVMTTRGFGLTTVTVTATDACKASCSFTFMVLIRDASRPVDLYPNPVVDKLNIRPGVMDQLEVTVTNRVGATVWSGSAAAGPFTPMSVDLSAQPVGIYYVHVKGADVDDNYTIAKK